MPYAASCRHRELAIRFALGAAREQVVGLILRQSVAPVAAGVAIGLGVAAVGGEIIGSLLYNVAPRDPLGFGLATAAIVGGAGLATLVPALRAGRIAPVEAMRQD